MLVKNTILLTITALVLIFLAGISQAESFEDVPRSHWAYDAVEYLASKGLVEGYPDGTFQGNYTMSRYELAMIVARVYAKIEKSIEQDEPVSIDVEAIMNDLLDEFEPELDEIRDLVKSNRIKIEDLEGKLKENSEKDSDLAKKVDSLGSKFKFSGSMKLRWQGKYYDPGNKRTQEPRIAFRFDMKAPVNKEIGFGGRISTAEKATGSEIALTDEFGIRSFNLERAYLQWEPEAWPNWTVTCGKFDNVWLTPSLWVDPDVNVEGVAVEYNSEENWIFNLSAMTPVDKGGYIVAQVGAEDLFTENLDVYLTYHFLSSGAFETMWTAFPYWYRLDADEYTAIEAYVKYILDTWDWPIGLEAGYRQNLASEAAGLPSGLDSGLQQAAMAKISFGKAKNVGEYDFWIQWSKALPNSLIPQWDDPTYGANMETWAAGMTYKLINNVDFKFKIDRAEYLVSDPGVSFIRLTGDIVCRF